MSTEGHERRAEVSTSPGVARALLVGVERYGTTSLPARLGTGQALRELEALLLQSGWEVERLSDDSPRRSDQPTRSRILEGCSWLAAGEQGLILLSLHQEAGALHPLTERRSSGAEETLSLKELSAALSPRVGLLLDGEAAPQRLLGPGWVICAADEGGPVPLFGGRGPSLFLHALIVSLSECLADGVEAIAEWGERLQRELQGAGSHRAALSRSLLDRGALKSEGQEPHVDAVATVPRDRGLAASRQDTEASVITDAFTFPHGGSLRLGAAYETISGGEVEGDADNISQLQRRRGSAFVQSSTPPLLPQANASYAPLTTGTGRGAGRARALGRGRYLLLRLLGEGGIGEVYLAEDRQMKLRRAIKLLKLPKQLREEQRELLQGRMRQAATAAQQLNEHSLNVVRVFDICLDEETGVPFMVMEFIEGETLGQLLQSGPLPPSRALPIARALCATLAHAHRLNIIHRDLKPENIMLTQRAESADFVKLLDFDLVKVERSEVKTVEGQILGTLEYMSPEQLKGRAIDPRADVFALGAIIFELFTGERANPGQSQGELIRALLDEGLPPVSQRAPQLPKALLELIERCLELDPSKRPSCAQALSAVLEELTPERFSSAAPNAPDPQSDSDQSDSDQSDSDQPDSDQPDSDHTQRPLQGASAHLRGAWWRTETKVGLLLFLAGAAITASLSLRSPEPIGREAPAEELTQPASSPPPLSAPLTTAPPSLAAAPPPAPPALLPQAFTPSLMQLPAEQVGAVEVSEEGPWRVYRGGLLTERWGRALFDLLPSAAQSSWSSAALRYQLKRLGEGLPLQTLGAQLQIDQRSFHRAQQLGLEQLNPLRTRALVTERGLIFLEDGACGLRSGDRLEEASWRALGHGWRGSCEREACAPRLSAALRRGRRAHASLSLRLRWRRWLPEEREESQEGCTLRCTARSRECPLR